jgi:hypothetical protein
MARLGARWLIATSIAGLCGLGCGETSREVHGFEPPYRGGAGAGGNGVGGGVMAQAGRGGAAPQLPSMHSDWMMEGFEDPVAISFGRHIGCFTGLPPIGDPEDDCGTLRPLGNGNDERHFSFAMTFDNTGPHVTYAADVYISEDGERMAGSFVSFENRTGDVPLPAAELWRPGHAWFPLTRPSPGGGPWYVPFTVKDLPVPERYAKLAVVEDELGLAELSPDQTYWFELRDTGRGLAMVGQLGAFFDTELRWDEVSQTLSAGPVAETVPTYPVALDVSYVGGKVSEARATTAAGGKYRLIRAAE